MRPLAALFLNNNVNEVVEIAATFSCILAVIRCRYLHKSNSTTDRHSYSSGTFYAWCMPINDEREG